MRVEADLGVFNGNIITMDSLNPTASAVAVKSYKVLAVGTDDEIVDYISEAKRVIDLGGKTVVPGFIDAHTHLTNAGIHSSHVCLDSAKSLGEAKQILKEALPRYSPKEWVIAYGWDESFWPENRYLKGKDLDSISKTQPIAAIRMDGHLITVNTMGLEKMGYPLELEGVQKDRKGRATGILKDIDDMYDHFIPSPERIKEGVIAGNKIANRHGITTAVDNIRIEYLRYIREIEKQGALTTRMIVNPPVEQMKHIVKLGLGSGMGSPLFRIGGVKIYTDGSIGARTAAVSKGYLGQKKNKGMLLLEQKKYSKIVRTAVRNEIQTVTHAIGDRAIEMVISTFEDLKDKSRIRDQRHRIEHAEMISEKQIRRAVSLGLILSMQPNFVGRWQLKGGLYENRFEKEQVEEMNMFRVALDNGARVCFGSDGMPYGPLYGIWSATTHPNPKVRLTVDEALRCYTMESAYSVFQEKTLGSISIGKRADFVVLSDNILTPHPKYIKDFAVEKTIVGGIEEYRFI
jgi:predicted amidohydrolase YtcJ